MILPAVQGRDSPVRDIAKHRKMEVIDVKVKNIEFGDARSHLVEHEHVVGDVVPAFRVEPDGADLALREAPFQAIEQPFQRLRSDVRDRLFGQHL